MSALLNGWTGAVLLSGIVIGVAMTCVAYMTWLERKVAARMQNRIGHDLLTSVLDLPFRAGRPDDSRVQSSGVAALRRRPFR